MPTIHLILGVLLLSVGLFTFICRDQIVARHLRRRAHAQPPMLWIVVAGLLTLNGALQVLLAI